MEGVDNNSVVQEKIKGTESLEDKKRRLMELDLERARILDEILEQDPGFEDPKHLEMEEAYNLILEQNAKLEEMIMFEKLTGLYSRVYMMNSVLPDMFEERHEGEEKRKSLEGYDDRAILMIDADRFKTINDTYGHGVGDQVLKAIAEVIKESVRFDGSDYPSRWGGEEIMVLLTKASPYEAMKVAERINRKIREAKILENILGKDRLQTKDVTVSIGIGFGDKYSKWEHIMSNADNAVYHSKNSGRDKVSLFDPQNQASILSSEVDRNTLNNFKS